MYQRTNNAIRVKLRELPRTRPELNGGTTFRLAGVTVAGRRSGLAAGQELQTPRCPTSPNYPTFQLLPSLRLMSV